MTLQKNASGLIKHTCQTTTEENNHNKLMSTCCCDCDPPILNTYTATWTQSSDEPLQDYFTKNGCTKYCSKYGHCEAYNRDLSDSGGGCPKWGTLTLTHSLVVPCSWWSLNLNPLGDPVLPSSFWTYLILEWIFDQAAGGDSSSSSSSEQNTGLWRVRMNSGVAAGPSSCRVCSDTTILYPTTTNDNRCDPRDTYIKNGLLTDRDGGAADSVTMDIQVVIT